MKILKPTVWVALSVAMLGVVGCDVFLGGRAREDRVYVQERTAVYVEEQPRYVVVQQAPPPIIVERRPQAPSAAYIWIDGSWNWEGQRYSWVAGRYERPPQPDVVWIAPRYETVGGSIHYTAGQWSKHQDSPAQGRGRGRGN